MKTGRSLQDLAAEIERRANAKKDLVARTGALSLVAEPTFANDHPTLPSRTGSQIMLDVNGQERFAVNTIAHGQIAEYADVPRKYYDRCLAQAPALLAQNVNHWLTTANEKRMVRTLDGTTRAFLSDRYRPLENEDFASAVLPVIGDLDLAVMSCEITDRRLYIKVVDKKVERELAAKGAHFGDGRHNIVRCLSPAVTLSNSEVGLGALNVLGGVYDSFCSNLASFGERSTRKYHVGGKHEIVGEEAYALLSDETRRITDKALWAQIRDVVRGAFQRAQFDALCDKIAETAEQKIEGNVVEVVKLTAKKFSFTETEGAGVLKHLIEGGDLSRFGLYNAVTRAAQDLPDYDRATEFERLGANVIELPANEWRELAKAA